MGRRAARSGVLLDGVFERAAAILLGVPWPFVDVCEAKGVLVTGVAVLLGLLPGRTTDTILGLSNDSS